MDTLCPVGVVGDAAVAGGIVQLLAQAGHPVRLYGKEPERALALAAHARQMIERRRQKGKMAPEDARQAAAAIRLVDGPGALQDCPLIIESALQTADATRSVVATLESCLPEDAVIALNTSSVPVSVLAAGARRPERIAGLHFFEPAPLMKVVELVPGLRTAADVVDQLRRHAAAWGHQVLVVRDAPGFVVNHVGRALLTEGLRIVHECVASPAVVDAVARASLGLRLGPFELMDLTGLDVTLPVTEQLYRDFQFEPRLRPTPLPALRLAAGLAGGRGRPGFAANAEPPVWSTPWPIDLPLPPLWVDPWAPALRDGVCQHLEKVEGLVIDHGAKPGPDSLRVLLPLGDDASMAALRHGHDARRCVAVDAVSGLSPATLMAPPGVDPVLRDAALTLFGRAGPVHWIGDSPGFIAQRLLAAIVNTACDVAQQGLAAPADIDAAVALALGYPRGPMTWGDCFGPARVLAVLQAMTRAFGDPRDRPSPWLRRRAQLGLSLLQHG